MRTTVCAPRTESSPTRTACGPITAPQSPSACTLGQRLLKAPICVVMRPLWQMAQLLSTNLSALSHVREPACNLYEAHSRKSERSGRNFATLTTARYRAFQSLNAQHSAYLARNHTALQKAKTASSSRATPTQCTSPRSWPSILTEASQIAGPLLISESQFVLCGGGPTFHA